MEKERFPKPGEIYNHFKDKLYQVITVATNTETGELMVVYQALYGDFKTYVRSLEMFLSEVDHIKYPEVKQKYRFELKASREPEANIIPNFETSKLRQPDTKVNSIQEMSQPVTGVDLSKDKEQDRVQSQNSEMIAPMTEEGVNTVLLKFLDAQSFSKKLEVITSNRKYLDDRLINDMAVSLDCAVDEGPLEERIQGLIHCLQAMCRFEDKRLR